MKKYLFLLFTIALSVPLQAQKFTKVTDKSISLDNGVINREILIDSGRIYTQAFTLHDGESYCIPANSKEFSFTVNDEQFSGFSGWTIEKAISIVDNTGGEGVSVLLREKSNKPRIQIEINYMIYPDLPLIRKWMKIENISNEDLKLESLTTEDLVTNMIFYWSTILHKYARQTQFAHFVGDWDDPVVVVHNTKKRMGMALGNEAMGVLKRTAFNSGESIAEQNNIQVGLTWADQDYPFRKWLKPGQAWEAPKTFICLYENRDDAFEVVNEEVNTFMIKHMRPQIVKIKDKPTFVYNTWIPFNTNFNDSIIMDLVGDAADCGIQEFIIDVGWHVNEGGESAYDFIGPDTYGDWLVDENKFKGGLKPTFDYMKSKGIKPGLWMSVGSASVSSKVYKEHPEWFAEDMHGNPIYLQNIGSTKAFTASFGTDWKDYIKDKILSLVSSHGLAYVKLDFAVVTSAYVHDINHSGSYAKDHPYYRDHAESFVVLYERLYQLFDELHREVPDLFIDCTYETAGKHHLMDYAIANHAEGNWLSNFDEPSPVGPLRIRHLAWWRSPVMPASSLVIGNFELDDPEYEFGLKSLIGTLPIVLGDLRKLTDEQKRVIKSWASWMKAMQEKYDYMSYRKDLEGFGEPRQGFWDGWQRINFQTKEGGIIGVFKQNARENNRTVFVKDLIPDATYLVKLAPYGKILQEVTGRVLMEKGFKVTINKDIDGMIFEIGLK